MTSHRKNSLTETFSSGHRLSDEHKIHADGRWRRASLAANPLMNKLRPFIIGSKNDDTPECYNRVRYIRDCCKVLGDLWKTDKDFLNKSIDSDVSKAFREFRSGEVARAYCSPDGTTGAPSVLNQTIEDLVQIHDYIDSKRKEWLDRLKKVIDHAREKHSSIRQSMTELRDIYEKAQRKLESADSNLKKFQTRADRLTLANFEERTRELEDTRSECEQARTLARDNYMAETYRYASEEHSITVRLFSQYLLEQKAFYDDISQHLSTRLPEIEERIDKDDFKPWFGYDLANHCLKSSRSSIAYPIETCIRLLERNLREEGLFRLTPSQSKQKKLVAELDLQLIGSEQTLSDLGYDAHVAAGTLKQYLRELPDCLLTSELLPQWNQVMLFNNEQSRLQHISQLINQLPDVNYQNLCYLIRFLARVAEYSSENKMTPSNLAICIGCSILYDKDQKLFNASLSNSYTSASTILELMIIHHKQLFPNEIQQEQPPSKSLKSQPDIIPTEFLPKSRSVSNENLLEVSTGPTYVQPSPSSRRKNKAPRPPTSSIQSIPSEQVIHEDQSADASFAEQTSNNQQSTGATGLNFGSGDKIHRRTPSGGTPLDRPAAPPPLPPQTVPLNPSPAVQRRQKFSFSPLKNTQEQTSSLTPEEKATESDDTSNDASTTVSTSNHEGVKVGKLISELNNRMAAAKLNNTQPNNIRASTIRNSTLPSPTETTDF